MRKSLIITVVIALLCLCGCEAVVTVPESPEPTKASEMLLTTTAAEESTDTSEIGMNDEITAKDCKPISHDDAIEDKVIVIRGNVLRPEFRHASHQLMLCTGGFGAQKNARGRTCYCISLYSGKQTSFYRGDVLGVMDERTSRGSVLVGTM